MGAWDPLFPEYVTVQPRDIDRQVDRRGEPARFIPRASTIEVLAEVDENVRNQRRMEDGGGVITDRVEIRVALEELEAKGWSPDLDDRIVRVRDEDPGGRSRDVSWFVTAYRTLDKSPGGAGMVAITCATTPAARQSEGR